MAKEIEIKVKKEKLDLKDLKKVKDGPGVSDIKESKGKKPVVKKKKRSRVVRIKERIRRKPKEKVKTRRFRFKAYYLLIILFLFCLAAIFYFIYWLLEKDKIIKIIPENAAFYTRINYEDLNRDYDEGKIGTFIAKFTKKDNFKKGVVSFINENLVSQYGLDFSEDVSQNIGKEIAFSSFLVKEGKQQKLDHALILEVKDKNKARDIIKGALGVESVKSENFAGIEVNEVILEEKKLNFYYILVDNLFVLAKSKESLEKVISVYQKKETALSSYANFNKTVFYHIRLKNHYFYLNLANISLKDLPQLEIFGYRTKDLAPFYVFLKRYQSLSFYLEPKENGLNLCGFTLFKEKSNDLVKISDSVPGSSLGVISSYDLKKEWLSYLKMLKEEDKNKASYYSDLEQNLENEYKISLKKDIYPLLEKESELIVYSSNKGYDLAIILNSGNKEKEKLVVEKLERALSSYFGMLNPKEKTFDLAEGTEAVEYFSNKDKFPFKDIEIEDIKAKGIVNPKASPYTYAFLDNKLAFSTSKDLLEKIVLARTGDGKLIEQGDFKEVVSANKSNNGLIYVDINKISDKMGISEDNSLYKFKKFVLRSDSNYFGTDIKGHLLVK